MTAAGATAAATKNSTADDQRATYSYTLTGKLDQRDLFRANGGGSWIQEQATSRSYYDNGLAKGLTTYNGSNTIVEQHSLGYVQNGIYDDGNRTSDTFTRSVPSETTAACVSSSCTASWTYDARDRLTNATDGAGGGVVYTLDVQDDVTQELDGASTTQMTYNGTQSSTTITPAGVVTRSIYDSNGNLDCTVSGTWVATTCPAPGSNGLLTDYVYDYKNRLADSRTYDASGVLNDSRRTMSTMRWTDIQTTIGVAKHHGGSQGECREDAALRAW